MSTRSRRREVIVVGLTVWVLLLSGIVALESVALVRPHDAWPALSDLLRMVTRSQMGRWIAFGLWLWLGWHLFIRGWDFFLHGAPLGDGAPSNPREAAPTGPITFRDVTRADIGPLLVFYAACLISLVAYGRRAVREPVVRTRKMAVFGSRGTFRHVAGTALGGYGAFLLGTTAYYALVASQPPSFLAEALWGGAFLAFCVAVPVYMLLVRWLYVRRERKR
jgi:hypothetical protein